MIIWLQNCKKLNNSSKNAYNLIIQKDPLFKLLIRNFKQYNKNLFEILFSHIFLNKTLFAFFNKITLAYIYN